MPTLLAEMGGFPRRESDLLGAPGVQGSRLAVKAPCVKRSAGQGQPAPCQLWAPGSVCVPEHIWCKYFIFEGHPREAPMRAGGLTQGTEVTKRSIMKPVTMLGNLSSTWELSQPELRELGFYPSTPVHQGEDTYQQGRCLRYSVLGYQQVALQEINARKMALMTSLPYGSSCALCPWGTLAGASAEMSCPGCQISSSL